jgi:hypothetical protein
MQDDAAFGTEVDGPSFDNAITAQVEGANAIRMFVYWNRIAPSPNSCTPPPDDVQQDTQSGPTQYNWAALDKEFANARATPRPGGLAQMGVFIVFGAAFPCWASADPARDTQCPIVGGVHMGCTLAMDMGAYKRMIGAVARRYGFAVSRWSPWNEPNLGKNGQNKLLPRTGYSDTPTQSGLIYRALWFSFKTEMDRLRGLGQPVGNAPIWFGETNGSVTTTPGNSVLEFLQAAACKYVPPASPPVSADPLYHSCAASNPAIAAEALSYHPYGSGTGFATGTPQDHLIKLDAYTAILQDFQGRGLITTPSYIAETEFGFNSSLLPGSAADQYTRQAAYINCADENAYKNTRNITVAQFQLQDEYNPNPTPENPLRHLGLRTAVQSGVGNGKPSYRSYQFPFTVFRRTSAPVGLEVWGQVRPNNAPGNQIVVFAVGGTYTKTLSVNSRGYFDAVLTDAPGGFAWRARTTDSAMMSRTASGTPTDPASCGPGWAGGDPGSGTR